MEKRGFRVNIRSGTNEVGNISQLKVPLKKNKAVIVRSCKSMRPPMIYCYVLAVDEKQAIETALKLAKDITETKPEVL